MPRRPPVVTEPDPPHLIEAFQMRGRMITKCHEQRALLRDDNRRMAKELETLHATIDTLTQERDTLKRQLRDRRHS